MAVYHIKKALSSFWKIFFVKFNLLCIQQNPAITAGFYPCIILRRREVRRCGKRFEYRQVLPMRQPSFQRLQLYLREG